MTPAEVDDKIVKLLRLAEQRDNPHEATAARELAGKMATRHRRDIDTLRRRAEAPPRAASPQAEDIDAAELEAMFAEFAGAVLGNLLRSRGRVRQYVGIHRGRRLRRPPKPEGS